jgi:hypothetical protein
MRLRLFCIALVSCLAACGHDHAAEPFDTFSDCYTDHHDVEALTVSESIVVCCLDHDIGGAAHGTVCGTTAADCVTYITANTTGPTSTEIMSSCDEYIVQKSQ